MGLSSQTLVQPKLKIKAASELGLLYFLHCKNATASVKMLKKILYFYKGIFPG